MLHFPLHWKFGLTRIKVPDTDDRFYYVPAVLLSGTISYCGVDTGMAYFSIDEFTDGPITPLVCFNAIDGSVIQLQNPEYS